FAGLHPTLGRRQDHRLAGADDDGPVRLLRQLAGLERNVAPADRHADVGSALGGNCHQLSSTLLSGRVGTRVSAVRRRSLESPPSFTFVPCQGSAWLGRTFAQGYLRSPSSLISARYPSR